jgi:hypothetical protein
MLLFSVGCFVYQTEYPCGFQKSYQQLMFPADLEENIGTYFTSPLAIRIGEIQVLQSDLQSVEQESFRLRVLIVYFSEPHGVRGSLFIQQLALNYHIDFSQTLVVRDA